MKKITTLMCAVALWCSAQAQAPALHFGRDGKFRIAQFTDVHLDLGTPYRRAQAEKTIAQMRYILDAEHPDLVVFTGDVVTGKPAAEAWHRVLEPVAERNLPFCVVLGNHDAEQDLTRAEIGRIVTSYAGTLNTLGAGGELADVVLEIAGTTQPAALLYCLDSHDYSTIPSIDGYGWFTQEQVGWYRARSAAYTAANGGKPLPGKIYSYNSMKNYKQATYQYLKWAQREHGCRQLPDARQYTGEYLRQRMDDGKSAWTVRLDAAALAKLYGVETGALGADLHGR